MSIYRRAGSKIYYINITRADGKRIRQSSGTTNRVKAKKLHDKIKGESWDVDKLNKKQKRSWEEAVIRYLKDIGNSVFNIGELRNLDKYLKGMYLHEIDEDFVNHIKYDRQSDACKRHKSITKKISSSSVNRTLQVLRAVLFRARDKWKWIDHAPTFNLVEIRGGKNEDFCWLTQQEAQDVLPYLPYHLKVMMEFTLATGLRESNVTRLKWKNINIKNRIAWVTPVESKNNTAIQIPLNDDAIEILLSQKNNHEKYVFTYKGKPIKKANTSAWRKALDKAGIRPYFPPPSADKKIHDKYPSKELTEYKYPEFRWHDLRHTWASWHVQSGTPLLVLQKLGGWKSFSMVQRYAHLGTSHVAEHANNICFKK